MDNGEEPAQPRPPRTFYPGELQGLGRTTAPGDWAVGLVEVTMNATQCDGVIAVCLSPLGVGMSRPMMDSMPDDAAFQAFACSVLEPLLPGNAPLKKLPRMVQISSMPASMQLHFTRCMKSLSVKVEFLPELPAIVAFEKLMQQATEAGERGEFDEAGIEDSAEALINQPGMSIERIRAFAEAAAAFDSMEPWQLSEEEVLWKIEPACEEPGMKYCTVMGLAEEQYGLAFLPSEEAHQAMYCEPPDPERLLSQLDTPLWAVHLDEPEDLHSEDLALWDDDEEFPLSNSGFFPNPVGVSMEPAAEGGESSMKLHRPTGSTLSFMEGLLRVFADATRKHFARGKIEATVPTFDGPRTFILTAMPRVQKAVIDSKLSAKGKKGKGKKSAKPAPRPAQAASVLSLKVTLNGSKPPIWRRLLVRDDATLPELHDAIQLAFGWMDSHLHEFTIGEQVFSALPEEGFAVDSMFGGESGEDENGVLLRELKLKAKSKFKYLYDFGDGWEHEILVEKDLTPEAALEESRKMEVKLAASKKSSHPLAVCVAGARSGPLEDCGGIFGWENLCAIMADPKHPEYEERKEWAQGYATNALGELDFDPERFKLKPINEVLQTRLKV